MTDGSPPPDYDQVVRGHRCYTTPGSRGVHIELISPPAYSPMLPSYYNSNFFCQFLFLSSSSRRAHKDK